MIWLKWHFIFINASKKVLISLKHIINNLTVIITRTYGFDQFGVTLVKINPKLSDIHQQQQHQNDRLYVLIEVSYYTDIRRM